MKKFVTNNYILVDLGNTCIKACIYNKQTKQLSNCMIDTNTTPFSNIIAKMRAKHISKVIFIASANVKLQEKVLKQIKQYCKDIVLVDRKVLSKLVDLSNINKNVVIGNDILLLLYYLSRFYDKAAGIALGTVYYLIVNNKKQLKTVNLIPNLATGLDVISKKTAIPDQLTPEVFDKDIGLNTPNAFAAGIKAMLDGYLENVSKTFKIPKKHIFVSGGDSFRFKSLSKKYQFVRFGSLKALACLTNEKKW